MNDLYINKCKAFIYFMISQRQWSGINEFEVDKWIRNFKNVPEDDIYLVYKLLTHIIYFSESDIVSILKEGVFKCVVYETALDAQKNNNFNLSEKALKNIYQQEIEKTCFVPLLDSDSPYESGNSIARIMVQKGIIPQQQSMFIEDAPCFFQSGNICRLVIVDDCVGSGDQLCDFWTTHEVVDQGNVLSIKELCEKYSVSANYLTLFGYSKNIQNLNDNFSDLNIFCSRLLNDHQRVFSDTSYIWSNKDERNRALELFESLTRDVGIPVYGYKDLDFAFIMHQTIPDWSLPLFWKQRHDWNLLVRRKNSDE